METTAGVNPDVVVDCSGDESRNSFLGKTEASPAIELLDRTSAAPSYLWLRALFPVALKQKLRSKFRRPIGAKPKWDEATRQWAIERLQGDIQHFLAHAGKPADFWSWELDAEAKSTKNEASRQTPTKGAPS